MRVPAVIEGPFDSVSVVLTLTKSLADEMVTHCLRGLPLEACGLLAGDPQSGEVHRLYPAENLARSALVYTLDPKAHLRADREAEEAGWSIIGVFHSHTHTEAHPSPTDVGQAPDPTWHYVIVSLRAPAASIRSFRIVDGAVSEEPLIIG
jgi:proteasome lid subunit RPN8/RPN11